MYFLLEYHQLSRVEPNLFQAILVADRMNRLYHHTYPAMPALCQDPVTPCPGIIKISGAVRVDPGNKEFTA